MQLTNAGMYWHYNVSLTSCLEHPVDGGLDFSYQILLTDF